VGTAALIGRNYFVERERRALERIATTLGLGATPSGGHGATFLGGAGT